MRPLAANAAAGYSARIIAASGPNSVWTVLSYCSSVTAAEKLRLTHVQPFIARGAENHDTCVNAPCSKSERG